MSKRKTDHGLKQLLKKTYVNIYKCNDERLAEIASVGSAQK